MTDPKQFYANYQADTIIDAVDTELAKRVLSYLPKSVFEFGSGSGKNLQLIKHNAPDCETWGLDISIVNVFQTHCNGADCTIRGDERHIPKRHFDVVFTCSVLDHIEDIKNIVSHFKQIARKAIILAETNSFSENFYYQHDYESYGFEAIDFEHVSEGDGGVYKIWIKQI